MRIGDEDACDDSTFVMGPKSSYTRTYFDEEDIYQTNASCCTLTIPGQKVYYRFMLFLNKQFSKITMKFCSAYNDREEVMESSFSMNVYYTSQAKPVAVFKYFSYRGEKPKKTTCNEDILTEIGIELGVPLKGIKMAEFLMILANIPVGLPSEVINYFYICTYSQG